MRWFRRKKRIRDVGLEQFPTRWVSGTTEHGSFILPAGAAEDMRRALDEEAWHTADGDPGGERALEAHLFPYENEPYHFHVESQRHDGLPLHQHAFVLRNPFLDPAPEGDKP